MLSFIDDIIKAFLGIGDPDDHPFSKAVATNDKFEEEETTEQLAEGLEIVTWGNKDVLTKVQRTEEGYIFEQVEDDSKRLKSVAIDDFDRQACREHNATCTRDSQKVTLNEMKLVKTYVLSGMTYKEIEPIVGYGKRWLQRVGPRVKAAQVLRRKSLSPTAK